MNQWCQTMQSDYKFARFGTDKNGSGRKWRCYRNLKDAVEKACISDDFIMVDCQAPNPDGGLFYTRVKQLEAIIDKAKAGLFIQLC